MTPTRPQLNEWQLWTSRDSGTQLDKAMDRLGELLSGLLHDIDGMDLNGSWTGDAQRAAFDRAVRVCDNANRMRDIGGRLATAARAAANELEFPRDQVLQLASGAGSDGFSVSDDWQVVLSEDSSSFGDPESSVSAADLYRWQEQITQAYNEFTDIDRRIAQRVAEMASELPTPADTSSPGVPSPNPAPPSDGGQGPHGSQPTYSRGDDLLFSELVKKAADAAELSGWTHAAKNLRHYLDNSGVESRVDPDEIQRDVPKVQQTTNELVSAEVNRISTHAASDGTYGVPVPFQSDWTGVYIGPEDSKDWFYAMGGIEQSVTGIATVYPPSTPGAEPTVTVDYQTHVFDRYNWDGTKTTTFDIPGTDGVTISDERMGSLHTAGLAQEFDISGSGSTFHYDGPVVPNNSTLDLPSAPDSRNGQRSDPER